LLSLDILVLFIDDVHVVLFVFLFGLHLDLKHQTKTHLIWSPNLRAGV
jgi:hypothetical protein